MSVVSIKLKACNLIKFTVIVLLVFILTINVNIISSSAYWGYKGNCEDSHGISYLKLPYDPDATIILDGHPSESFWSDPVNKDGRIIVPLASRIGTSGEPDIIIYMNATFIMNREY